MTGARPGREYLIQAITVVGVSTLVLTASFVGILALMSGRLGVAGERLPWYALAMGVAFVSAVLGLSHQEADAETVLLASSGLGVITLVMSLLAVEGVMYAITAPEKVFASHLVVYFLAAGLIATGLTFWLVTYWREFIGSPGPNSHL